MSLNQRRKSRRAVERGYGPRHAFNAQEGDELVPEELPEPPPEELVNRRNSMGNLRPALLLKALGEELGSLTKEDVAKLGISLLMGGEGPREPSLPPSAKVKQPGLKMSESGPRYEGPPEAKSQPPYDALKEKYPEIKEGPYKGQKPFNPQESEDINAINQKLPPYDALKEVPPEGTKLKTWDDYAASVKPVKSDPNEPHPDELKYWHEMTPEEKAQFNSKLDAMSKEDLMGTPPPKAQDALDKLMEHYTDNPPPEGPQPPEVLPSGKPNVELPPEEQARIMRDWAERERRLDEPDDPMRGRNWDDLIPPRFKKGTSGVRHNPKPVGHPRKIGAAPGFGPRHAENSKEGDLTQQNTDTVPAMLTPREAVLNRNAAELAGRSTIEKLNARGNELAKKGVDLAAEGDKDVLHLQGGTSDWQWKQDEDGNWVPFSPSGQTGAPPPIPWQDPTPVPTATPDPNVKINPPGGVPGGGSISGGPFSGWTPFQMDQWHSGAGPGSMGFPSFEGNTLGPGGQQLAFNTTSYNVPGFGWVPHAQLANAMASTNPQDYFSSGGMQLINGLGWDPSKPTYGFGSGEPSRRGIDQGLNVLGNATGIPGLGWGLGKVGRGLWHLYQNWQMRHQDAGGSVTTGPLEDVQYNSTGGGGGRGDRWHDIFGPRWSSSGIPGVGVGISPTGQPAVGREWWSPDFGREDLGPQGTGAGNYNLAGPGGGFIGSRGIGGGGTLANTGISFRDIAASGVTPRGTQSVGAPQGGFAPMGFSGPSNLTWGQIGMEGQDRPHFNPYFGGYSQDKQAGGPSVKLRAKGDSDVEGKKNMKSKPKTSKPSGSPYAQGYEKLQGGGTAGGKDGSTPYGFQQHNINLATPGWTPPERVGGLGTGAPPPRWGGVGVGNDPMGGPPPQWGGIGRGGDPIGGPPHLGGGAPGFHGGAAPYLGGGPNPGLGQPGPYQFAGIGVGSDPAHQQMPYGWKQHQRNLGNTTIPGQGGGGGGGGQLWGNAQPFPMPLAKGPFPQATNKLTPPGGGFYPPGQGFYAGGTGDVGIGDPNPQAVGSNFGAPPQLSAPDLGPLVSAITKEAQKQGLSASQIQSILGAFKGMGGGGGMAANYAMAGSPTPVYGESGYPSAIPVGGYQGGISEIGYPPGIAPNATFSYDEGGWTGPLDPRWSSPGYQRGTSRVPGYWGGAGLHK